MPFVLIYLIYIVLFYLFYFVLFIILILDFFLSCNQRKSLLKANEDLWGLILSAQACMFSHMQGRDDFLTFVHKQVDVSSSTLMRDRRLCHPH